MLATESKNNQKDKAILPPMKFVCELPKSANKLSDSSWTDSALSLDHLGPILDKYMQNNPYCFQAEAIPKVIRGKDLLITAGTGSGKTEIFLFAILELLLQGKISNAIIFYPSKQLIQNQEARLAKYLSWIQTELNRKITYSSYTGDLSQEAIVGIERACPKIILATFDKVFHRIIRHQGNSEGDLKRQAIHAYNQQFFDNLISSGVVVFDEIHTYSGLMLSNIHNFVMLQKAVNPESRVLLSSATIAEATNFRDKFLPLAEIVSGKPRRGPIQILMMDKSNLEQFNHYIQNEFLCKNSSSTSKRRVLLFNDSISENEALTYTIKQQLAKDTGIKLQNITAYNQNTVACIHSQLPPGRKQAIVRKAEKNQLLYLISTDLLAQGLNFPDFYMGVQIGWPITGLTGAVQRIGRLRFSKDLNEVRYFIFILDKEDEQEGYLLTNPKVLAKKLLEQKLPPLIFSRDNFRIIQGFVLLALAYGVTSYQKLKTIYCSNNSSKEQVNETISKKIKQVLTFLVSLGIISVTNGEIVLESSVELALFLGDYSLRPIPPKWTVTNHSDDKKLFSIDSRKVLREALPGNVLLNDERFWLIKRVYNRYREIFVEELTLQDRPDVAKLEKNKTFSPEFSFGRFTKTLDCKSVKAEFGDLQVLQRPSKIHSYTPTLGHTTIDLLEESNTSGLYANLSLVTYTSGLVLTIPKELLEGILKHLYNKQKYYFLRMIARVLLAEASQTLHLSKREVVTAISWTTGKEALAIYDLAGPSGNSQKIFLNLKQLLVSIHSKLSQCDCFSSCTSCVGDLSKYFKYNPKTFLLKWLELVVK